jgi:hypothetical protein
VKSFPDDRLSLTRQRRPAKGLTSSNPNELVDLALETTLILIDDGVVADRAIGRISE